MNKLKVLDITKKKLETKLSGSGSLRSNSVPPLLISAGIYASIITLFMWILPNMLISMAQFTTFLHPSKLWNILSLNLSFSSLLLITVVLLIVWSLLYREFMGIRLTTTTVRQLQEKYNDNDLIVYTISRWITEKGFLNYTDKETIREYYGVCKEIEKLENQTTSPK